MPAYGVYQGNVPMQPGDYILQSVATIAANSSTTQAGGTPVTTQLVMVSSGGAGYSITLPPSVPGNEITVHLTTAGNTVKAYPSPGEAINALGANAAITMAALSSASFCCATAGQWFTVPRVPS